MDTPSTSSTGWIAYKPRVSSIASMGYYQGAIVQPFSRCLIQVQAEYSIEWKGKNDIEIAQLGWGVSQC